MAVLHQTTLTPSKIELLAAWLPQQPWFTSPVADPRPLGTFRIDDPDGEVGIEVMLAECSDGQRWLITHTYRGEPLPEGTGTLVGITEHGVLGTRYVYDGVSDPVFCQVVAATIRSGGHEAELVRLVGGNEVAVEKTMTAHGTGGDGDTLEVVRQPVAATESDLVQGSAVLLGRLGGGPDVVLVRLR